MNTQWIPTNRGNAIPARAIWAGGGTTVIVCHGFGSSKESPMVQALNSTLPGYGINVVSFDFTAHGESPAQAEDLRVSLCIDDLKQVEGWVGRQNPGGEISYFGSSFGAYITLLYLSRNPKPAARAFLRSAAVAMPDLVDAWVDEQAREDLNRQGYFIPNHVYVREMHITRAFLRDLAEHDVFSRYQKGMATLSMVHGEKDSVAPVADARRFAIQSGAELLVLPHGMHDLMGPGELDQVLERAVDLFTRAEG